MNILLKQIYAGIFVSIACWNCPYAFLECSDNLPNSTALHSHSVQCYWWYKLLVHWWMKGIYFASFYFRVWDLTREIRENKNPAKISTYTVLARFNSFSLVMWCLIYVEYLTGCTCSSINLRDDLKDLRTNVGLMCTNLNAIFMLNPNMP